MTTCYFLLAKYDINHWSALSTTPKSFLRISIRILWSIVSKAALMSSITSNVTSSLSILISMSFCTLRSAVSVECNWRYADWLTGSGAFSLQWLTNCDVTTFSATFARKWRLLTGLKFSNTKSTSANFQFSGTIPFSSDMLIIFLIIGHRTSQQSLSK